MILSSNIEVAERKTLCQHNKQHVISKGESRLKIKNLGQGYSYYCLTCAASMITMSKNQLELLEKAIK